MRKSFFICLLIMLFIISGCSNLEIMQEDFSQQITAHAVYENKAEAEQIESGPAAAVLIPIPFSESAEQADAPEIEPVSALRCVGDRIELFLTNPSNKVLLLERDVKVHINGMIVADPKCSTSELMPGKKVFCSDISGHLAIREGKENLLQINIASEKNSFSVDCGNISPSYEII